MPEQTQLFSVNAITIVIVATVTSTASGVATIQTFVRNAAPTEALASLDGSIGG